MGNNMPKDNKIARAIRAHIRTILLKVREELRSSGLASKTQNRSVEGEGQEKKPLLINDL